MYQSSWHVPQERKYFLLYDLETSRKEFIGQILTGYFYLVDQDFHFMEKELEIAIQVSRLELPHPEAILTNRIDILEHQKHSQTEKEASLLLHAFIEECIEICGPGNLKLLGYNSSRFDLPFFRTTFIRNGINPYFLGKIRYGDALHLVWKFSWREPDFPRIIEIDAEGNKYYSYSLENISHAFKILEGKQAHGAKKDVLLLTRLLKTIQNKYHYDLWEESNIFWPPEKVFLAKEALYEKGKDTPQLYEVKEYYRLDYNRNACLLVDLKRFREGERQGVIHYKNRLTGYIFPTTEMPPPNMSTAIEAKIHSKFQGITCDNFFPRSDCDIEQDIYRISFQDLEYFNRCVRNQSKTIRGSQDTKHLWRRYCLRNDELKENPKLTSHFQHAFDEYVKLRYLKGVKLNKFGDEAVYSETWADLNTVLHRNLDQANGTDKKLLKSLQKWYQASEIRESIDRLITQ